MPLLHVFRELGRLHILVPCGPAYHYRRGMPYQGHPPAHDPDPLKQDHPSGCAKPFLHSRRMRAGMDAQGSQPWLPLTAGHTLQLGAGPQSPWTPGTSGHLTVPGWRSFAYPTQHILPLIVRQVHLTWLITFGKLHSVTVLMKSINRPLGHSLYPKTE